ncbi:flagellar biosynthesis protein FlhF [Paenibacillus flagellatus]|uniref:Flagellar biosynthesis protein FlhF n=1 Tax=Paenibacillus flagellatus TaxID=2211139 RepID=A0A2V5JYM7_9BACL|nr:flagellar biosynthesis protein FlhF [Paenibacillus flagellatus]PYI50384.1 flagellar biosynthesis protein FlhF [Paenibacillus flagellatus]
MRVKRYVVDSMPDALQKIRTDLGKDAVILNTKEIRSGGFLGLFGKKKIEVIAATDSAQAQQPAPAAVSPGALKAAPSGGSTFAAFMQEAGALASRPAAAPIAPQPAASTLSAAVATLDEPVLPPVAPPASRSRAKEDVLLDEIKQMKELMAKLSAGVKQEPGLPEPIRKFERPLLEHEVLPELVERLLGKAAEEFESEGSPRTDEYAYQAVKKQLKDILYTPKQKGLASDTRIAHFVGPTGVGKTTTIAKLAAEQVLKLNRKVGFITSDTYRIAAVEQLKTYATILNVPLEVVFSPQELARAFQQLQDCDVIFMDTAGRNFRNQMYVSELNSLLQTKGKSETFLVLGLTSKYKDMKAITDNFAKFKLDKVLFTKMDETHSYGSIVNLLYDFPLQLSYITNGQNVPDDIIETNEDKLIDLLLEEREQ